MESVLGPDIILFMSHQIVKQARDGLETTVSEKMLAQAVPIELTAGSLSIHDSCILHGSAPDTSERRRADYTMHYANASTVKVDVANHCARRDTKSH